MDTPPSNWPLYYRDKLIVGDPTRSIGLVTLWTERKQVAAAVDLGQVAVVGQLYSHNRGISALLRNLLANPVITDLIVCGADKSGSGRALEQFFAAGVDQNHQIIGVAGGQLEPEIPLAALEQIRQNVRLTSWRNELDLTKVQTKVNELSRVNPPWAPVQIYPDHITTSPETLPSEKSNFVIRGKRVVDVWPQVLATVMDFGAVKRSQHTDDQREVVNLIVETNEDPTKPAVPAWLGFDQSELESYYPQVLTSDPVPGVNYSYGQRLMNHAGVDQIEGIINQLKSAPFTRRAVGVTWDVKQDHNNEHAPCLDLVQALINGEKLYLTAYFRSNDMYEAWPRNALALRQLQARIAREVGVELGPLTTISSSAHIYAPKWDLALEIVKKHGRRGTHVWSEQKQQCVWNQTENDPRGVMLIAVEEGEIKVIHQNWQTGEEIHVWRGKGAIALYNQLVAAGAVSQVGHAFDLGCELQKAELALNLGHIYEQDRPLKITPRW